MPTVTATGGDPTFGDIDDYTYEGGTLIIDFVNQTSKKMIWRGVAQGVLPDDWQSKEMEQLLRDAVAKILETFRPKNDDQHQKQ